MTAGAAAARIDTLLLVGCGKMGAALLRGWLGRGLARRYVVIEPGPGGQGFADRVEVTLAPSLDDAGEVVPDIIVLAVKPQIMADILPGYRRFAGVPVLSIAAGKTLGFFARTLGADAAVIRAMPNTPAAIGRGIAVACANPSVTASERALAERLLAAVGEVAWVEDETLLDAVTAVSGSGPAYVFLLIECLARAGRVMGLPEALADRLALATVAGAGELARHAHEAPATLRENVTSPGGTTRAALDVLMAPDGLEPLLIRAVRAATQRSRTLAD